MASLGCRALKDFKDWEKATKTSGLLLNLGLIALLMCDDLSLFRNSDIWDHSLSHHVSMSYQAPLCAAWCILHIRPWNSESPYSPRRLSGLIVPLPPSLQELINRCIKVDPDESSGYTAKRRNYRPPTAPGPLISDFSWSLCACFSVCVFDCVALNAAPFSSCVITTAW